MYLRDLAVYASDAAVMPPGRSARDFNLSTHTPVEAFLGLLPRRKVALGDLAKVNVVLGPRPAGQRAYFAALNVAILYWPRFDFARYFDLPRARQQLRIAGVLSKALSGIARRTHSSQAWYEAAYAAFRAKTLPLPEVSELELRRRWGLLPPREEKALKGRAARGAKRRP